MSQKPKKLQSLELKCVIIVAVAVWAGRTPAAAQVPVGTAFAYQGELETGGALVEGTYSVEFSLWDDPTDADLEARLGPALSKTVYVEEGRFNVILDFAEDVFRGNARWLEIAMCSPSPCSDFTTPTLRRKLSPTALALLPPEGNVNPQGPRTTQGKQSRQGPPGLTRHAWALEGNNGTTPGTNFLGTTDNVALELHVNGERALRLEPNATSPNLIGGYSGNIVESDAVGATITGGGADTQENRVFDDYGTVSGGLNNQAGSDDDDPTTAGYATVGGGKSNIASDDWATVGGGWMNTASATRATVGGGQSNIASSANATVSGGWFNTASGQWATIGGGQQNTADGSHSTVGGGEVNFASGKRSTVGGGFSNTASATQSTVGGGRSNGASGANSTVAGGRANGASASRATVGGGNGNGATGTSSTVAGGEDNLASGGISTVGGGELNHASGGYATVGGGNQNHADGLWSTVGGGRLNTTAGEFDTVGGGNSNIVSADYGTIAGGGTSNPADLTTANFVLDNYGTVGGGGNNQAGSDDVDPTNAEFATVAGGENNTASGGGSTVGGGQSNTASGGSSAVAGGRSNTASAQQSAVGGGVGNTASGDDSAVGGGLGNNATGPRSTVGGGFNNTASGARATLGGGFVNTASGVGATVPGGSENSAGGNNSLAAGNRAKANNNGMFVWSDDSFNAVFQGIDFPSATEVNFTPAARQFLARATGGVVFVSAIDIAGDTGDSTAGVELAAGGGSWSSLSSRHAKANVNKVDGREVLERLRRLPISTWNYKAQDESIRHIGPMAQDFSAAFGVGEKETMITTIDADGVALAAIQGLYEMVKEKDAEVASLRAEMNARIASLEKKLSALGAKVEE